MQYYYQHSQIHSYLPPLYTKKAKMSNRWELYIPICPGTHKCTSSLQCNADGCKILATSWISSAKGFLSEGVSTDLIHVLQ